VSAFFFSSNELRLESGLESSKNIDFHPDGKKVFWPRWFDARLDVNLKDVGVNSRRTKSVNIGDKNPRKWEAVKSTGFRFCKKSTKSFQFVLSPVLPAVE
jgi:hypothetical protein